jgi:transcriptional regulator with XRE-family HTH domain
MKRFAQLLGRYIETSGMKQTHIATTAHISYNYLQRLLAGDRHPSDQVVYNLAQALRLSAEQTGELLAAAGHAPPVSLLQSAPDQEHTNIALALPVAEVSQATRLAQECYRLAQEIPETLQAPFLEEMKHLLSYARYKYILAGGSPLLGLDLNSSQPAHTSQELARTHPDHPSLDVIAQLVGALHAEPGEDVLHKSEERSQPAQAVEDLLSAIDHLTGNILAGEVSVSNYQPQLIMQIVDMLREGAPWEIRRRIAEALPGLCQFDVSGAEHLMETLRLDIDEMRRVDIRRRVIEALPPLFEASPLSLSAVLRLLRPRTGDDIYVALATVEAGGDIQTKAKQLLESRLEHVVRREHGETETVRTLVQQSQAEIAKIQRQLLANWEGIERESLQFSLALHDLLCAPDTLLLSLREGLQSSEKLVQLVAARYVERLLSSRPLEALQLYQMLLRTATQKNVRRPVAKALPSLLTCLEESSLSTRALARAVISDLATDHDIYIRRAVADHAMQLFYIDREFLLILLRLMHKDTDQAIRYRLQPIALRLAQVWLIWYAETAGLVDNKRNRHKALTPFGE